MDGKRNAKVLQRLKVGLILGKFFKLGVAEKVLMGFLFGLGGLFLGVGFEVFSLSASVVVACLQEKLCDL